MKPLLDDQIDLDEAMLYLAHQLYWSRQSQSRPSYLQNHPSQPTTDLRFARARHYRHQYQIRDYDLRHQFRQ